MSKKELAVFIVIIGSVIALVGGIVGAKVGLEQGFEAGLVAALVLVTAYNVYLLRHMRTEDRGVASRRRRLDEVHRWINDVLQLKAEVGGVLGEPYEGRRRASFARAIMAGKAYVRMEAQRIDSEFGTQPKLADHIDRLCFIIEHTPADDLGADRIQQEIEVKCVEVLGTISDLKAKLEL